MILSMIHPDCFSASHIKLKAKELAPADPLLLEKAIHALALLGHLADAGLPFVFKGGTSLLLFMQPIRRLSIDVDIQCGEPDERVDEILRAIANRPPFTHHAPDDRGEQCLPQRRHFNFFFESIVPKQRNAFIQLDIVKESTCILPVIQRPIHAPFLRVEGETRVDIPTPEGLLADKLTAFAPRTLGVPLRKRDGSPGRTMQVAKQLFDVGELFGVADDLAAVAAAYALVAAQEATYRPRTPPISQEEALRDTLNMCEEVAAHGLKGVPQSPDAELLLDGAGKLKSHLVSARFTHDEVRVAAARTALLAGLLLRNATGALADHRYTEERFSLAESTPIAGRLAVLNKLKRSVPEAGYYWQRVAALLP
jgi:hypothetical protein